MRNFQNPVHKELLWQYEYTQKKIKIKQILRILTFYFLISQILCISLSFEEVEAEFPILLIFSEILAIPISLLFMLKNRKLLKPFVKEKSRSSLDTENTSRKLMTFSSIPKRRKKVLKFNPLFSSKRNSIFRWRFGIILNSLESLPNTFAQSVLLGQMGNQALPL